MLLIATLLTGLAGFVDAIGLMTVGPLFVSFMSGNSTQFAVSLGQVAWGAASPAGAVIGSFVVGVTAGRALANLIGPKAGGPAILVIEGALLAVVAAIQLPGLGQGVLMAFAMGAQNAVPNAQGQTVSGVTYVTGALVAFGLGAGDALAGLKPFSAALPRFLTWIALVVGGISGAVAYGRLGPPAVLIPSAVAVALAAALAAGFREADSRSGAAKPNSG